jgi:acetolactate synthase-1/3 small subunit
MSAQEQSLTARALPGSGEERRHLIVAIVNNKPGVLNRVASLMRARNFNIESLAVSSTDRADTSRMTLTIVGDEVHVEQAAKQLYKLIDVLKVQDVTDEAIVEHELALVKVRASHRTRAEIVSVVEMHHGRVVDLGDDAVVVEVVGEPAEVDRVVELLREFGIKELVRTGSVVMSRGSGSIEEQVKR